jgi:hypothetical protein
LLPIALKIVLQWPLNRLGKVSLKSKRRFFKNYKFPKLIRTSSQSSNCTSLLRIADEPFYPNF